jgi:hypothetical protein
MHAGATGHTASATKPRQLDICVSLDRTPTVIQPLAKWRFFLAFIALAVGIAYFYGAVGERHDGWRGFQGLAERHR